MVYLAILLDIRIRTALSLKERYQRHILGSSKNVDARLGYDAVTQALMYNIVPIRNKAQPLHPSHYMRA
jgi:hypothetical protein